MTGAQFLGVGISFVRLGEEETAELAADFPRAAESVAERFDFGGDASVGGPSYADWTFHYLDGRRWVARLAPYRDSEALYLEWNPHASKWDDTRAHDCIELLVDDPTKPLRTRPRATGPQEPT